jgi:formylglycine-generating enzyme
VNENMRKGRVAVVASVSTGVIGALAACNAVLGITNFTAASGSSDATMDHAAPGEGGGPGAEGGLTCSTQDGGAGAVGCPCQQGALGCNGYAQTGKLVCTSGTWTSLGNCTSGNCDTRAGNSQGTCAPVDPNCTDASPLQSICVGANVVQCGPDLVSETPVTTCDAACVNGGCTGVCVPSSTQCADNAVQTCSALGQWADASSCPEGCGDGGCAKFASCQPGNAGADTSCGPGSSEEGGPTSDCCSSPTVTGNSGSPAFYRSYDGVDGGLYTSKDDPATVSTLRLDAYEVTVGRFRNFVNAVRNDSYTPPPGSGIHTHLNDGSGLAAVDTDAGAYESGWLTAWNANLQPTDANLQCDPTYQTWTTSPTAPGADDHRPINCVNWYEAYAFCIWDGGFLPSEAEWNYAAAGGDDQREYPWPDVDTTGDASPPDISCSFANYSPSGMPPCFAAGPNDVGSESPMGDGLYGQSDLAGNVWEWVLDAYAPYVYTCDNCANLGSAPLRVTRGGSFSLVGTALLSSYRGNNDPTTRDSSIGVRCARVP